MITFGTSGWRGLIARDFTFDNVRLATQGVAMYLRSELANPQSAICGREPVIILGYDTRFLDANSPSLPPRCSPITKSLHCFASGTPRHR